MMASSGERGHHNTNNSTRESAAATTSSQGRRLFGAPVLLQDWDEQVEESPHQYWELFLDLLLVAAASSITDQFKEHLTVFGLGEFTVFYIILINSWLLYTHHVTTRFEDSSLAHSMVLFVYCLGFGYCIVNTGYNDVQAFCWGSILQRASVLWMLASFSACIPRARYFCSIMSIITGTTMVTLLVVALWGSSIQESPTIMALFWIAAGIEFLGEVVLATFADGRRLVPINIEQSKERLGALELIALGETVLSVCIIYREMKSRKEEEGEKTGEEVNVLEEGYDNNLSYYWVMSFSFLLIFMFLLLFFHMQPSPEDHAFRRSRFHGVSLLLLYKVLGLAFLAVGTSVKLVVECHLLKEEMPPFATALMGYSVGFAILCLLGMRYLHYGGRDCIKFGHLEFMLGLDPNLDRLATIWWLTVGIAAILPFVGIWSGFTFYHDDPLTLTGTHALLLFFLCVTESYYSHTIQDALTKKLVGSDRGNEEENLVASVNSSTAQANYKSIN